MPDRDDHRPSQRWECGSEFHWYEDATAGAQDLSTPWNGARFAATGRDSLRLLIEHGVRAHQWEEMWVPSYFCQEVLAALSSIIVLRVYEDLPGSQSVAHLEAPTSGRSVLFVSNTFGLREPGPYDEGWIAVIEDHTHDPWSDWARSSQATYCVASLRKTLPVPDGAAYWSPKMNQLPSATPASAERAAAVADKLAAMLLKRWYLQGRAVEKNEYRECAVRGETNLPKGSPSRISDVSLAILRAMPVDAWRERRRSNWRVLSEHLEHLGLSVLQPDSEKCTPFSLICQFSDKVTRERVRAGLIQRGVYPAVLWPMDAEDWSSRSARALSERMLSIHCDMRYTARDMARVGEAVGIYI